MNISIHALREEGDRSSTTKAPTGTISIHALREEGDNAFTANERAALLFLSTPSARRATRLNFRASSIVGYFYPRPPRGGRRAVHRPLRGREDISIHALREEGDS